MEHEKKMELINHLSWKNKSKTGIRTLLILVISLIYCGNVYSQPDAPDLRCISVEANGAVTLTWIAPTDTGAVFGGYHIFFSNTAAGPFTPIDSIFNYSTVTTTVNGVNANNAALYFYIKTRDGCCNNYSPPGNTLRSMRIIVTPLSNEAVRLTWNRISTPPLPSTLSSFVLSKELTAGIYTNFKTLLDTSTTDTNIFCNKFINYKVTQGDLSGCNSVSSIDGELFRDTKGPSQTLMDTVSVDPITGDVTVAWLPDSSADTQGYVIYQFNGLSYDSIGTVNGINSVSFLNNLTNAASVSETYTVAAFDSCKNLGALATNHSTILLTKNFVKCTATISLEWSPYQNIKNGLSRYEIWFKENGGAWMLDGLVPANILNYQKVLTSQGAVYEFLIRAVGNSGKTSSSNTVIQIADIFNQPEFLYIRSLNVSGNGVSVKCFVDQTGDIVSYRLYRGNSQIGPFVLVDDQPYIPNSNIVFNDPFSGADAAQRFYKITATDSCGLEQVSSNVAGTVFLNAEGGNDFINDLTWIDYFGWPSSTGHFNLYRVINGQPEATPFVAVNGDTVTYAENVSNLQIHDGNICYAVQAVESSVNSYGFQDSSLSNISCAPQSPSVYIPNAFTPGGKNPFFKPVVVFGDPENYTLKIYNRWGQLVFNSSTQNSGWNGKYQDTDAIAGVYAYILVFKGYNKKEVRRTGTVLLIR